MNWSRRSVRIFLSCAIGVLCLVIAFLAFDALRDRPPKPLATVPSEELTATATIRTLDLDSTSKFQDFPGDSSEVGALVRILSKFERTMALDRLLEDATSSRLLDLLIQTETVQPQHLRDEFRQGIIRKFAIIDPVEALKSIDETDQVSQTILVSAIFEEWSASSPDQAIKYVGDIEKPRRGYALQGLLKSGVELPESVRRELAHDFDIRQFALDQKAAALLTKSLDNPAKEWHSLLADFASDSDSLSDIQRNAAVHVASEWLGQDGIAVMPSLMESFPLRDDKVWLTKGIIQRLAATDSDSLRSFAAEMERTHHWVLMKAIEDWAASDGENALHAARVMDREDAVNPAKMQRATIDSWASNRPHSLVAALPRIPVELRLWSQQTALMAMGYSTPESVPALLRNVQDDLVREMVVINVVREWAKIDPYAAFEWASTDPTLKDVPGDPPGIVFGVVARQNPYAAIPIAKTFPVDSDGIGPEAGVINAMARLDVEAAIGMLDSARNKATRRSAYVGIGRALVRQGESGRAIQLVENEPEAVQSSYFNDFAYIWLEYHPLDMLAKIEDLPTIDAKKVCSSLLQRRHEREPFLDAKDLEKIAKYVDDIDQQVHEHEHMH